MTRLGRLFADYTEAGSLDALVTIDSTLDDQVFLTRCGHVLTVVKANPRDYECLDPEQLDAIARRFEGAARSLDESITVRQYLLKRSELPISQAVHANPVVNEALQARAQYLEGRAAELYALDIYFVFLYTGWRPLESGRARTMRWISEPRRALHQVLSPRAAVSQLDDGLARARAELVQNVESLIVQLRDVVPLEVLRVDDAFRFFRRLLNYAPHKAESAHLKHTHFIGSQAADSALECHRDHLRLDDHFVQVLTLKEPPVHTFAHLLRDLQEIPSNFVIATEWTRADNGRVRRLIQSKRRHFYNSKASLAAHLSSTSQTSPKDQLIDTGAAAHVDALGACLEEIEVNGRHFGEFSLTVVLYDLDRLRLQRSAAECFKVFAAHDARVVEERYNLLNAWLAVLPGNEAYNLRRIWLLNTNYADLSFLFGQRTGDPVNAHLQREHLALLESSSGTPFYLNLHVADVAHTLVLGATGSGKSFLLNFLITFLQQYEPRTFIFDLGGGYNTLARLFGGAAVPIGRGERAFSINPFCLPPTPEHLHFLASFVRVLIESSGYAMTAADETDLAHQIDALYAIEPGQRRLLTLSSIVRRSLRGPLEKWVEGGSYAAWFDNASDSVTLAQFQAFDFEGMSDYPQILEPLVFYILHRASAAISDAASAGVFKVFVLDEAWRFFRHPVINRYIVEALKTFRKKNAALILATQSLDDLRQSALLPVVVESCPTQLFLANPGMNREIYREVFHLNHTETARIAELIPKRQILVRQPHLAKVVNLNVDPKSYWLFSHNAQDDALKREVFERHGVSKGLEILVQQGAPHP